jgi:hypothetical protein
MLSNSRPTSQRGQPSFMFVHMIKVSIDEIEWIEI